MERGQNCQRQGQQDQLEPVPHGVPDETGPVPRDRISGHDQRDDQAEARQADDMSPRAQLLGAGQMRHEPERNWQQQHVQPIPQLGFLVPGPRPVVGPVSAVEREPERDRHDKPEDRQHLNAKAAHAAALRLRARSLSRHAAERTVNLPAHHDAPPSV